MDYIISLIDQDSNKQIDCDEFLKYFRIVLQELSKNLPKEEPPKEELSDESPVLSPINKPKIINPWKNHVSEINWFLLNVDKKGRLSPRKTTNKIDVPPLQKRKSKKEMNELRLADIQEKNFMEARSFLHMDDLLNERNSPKSLGSMSGENPADK